MLKVCSVCHDGNELRDANEASFAKLLAGRLSSSTWQTRSLVFIKEDRRTDKATNHIDCTEQFATFSLLHREFLGSTLGSKSPRYLTERETFSNTESLRRRHLFLKTKLRFYKALFPTVVDLVAMRAWARNQRRPDRGT